MNNNLTDITLLVDRSGSMESVREDAEGGVNAFLRQQAALPGDALITLVQFDTEYEFLARGISVREMQPFHLVPRGNTALLDAMGRAMNETGARLEKLSDAARPGLFVFVVMTDGKENSSLEFTKAQIKSMIERPTTKYQWHFTFLGADQDAIAEAADLGIGAIGTAAFAQEKVIRAFRHTSSKVARMRSQAQASVPIDNAFTAEERKDLE